MVKKCVSASFNSISVDIDTTQIPEHRDHTLIIFVFEKHRKNFGRSLGIIYTKFNVTFPFCFNNQILETKKFQVTSGSNVLHRYGAIINRDVVVKYRDRVPIEERGENW